jgi:PAS domain S-box-containing protein
VTDPPGHSPAADPVPEESLEELYEQAPCGYVSTRPDGTFARVNQTFLSWTGHGRADLIGLRRFQDLLTGGGRIFYETHYMPLLAMQGRVQELAFEIICRDGRRLPVFLNSVQKRDPSGAAGLIRTTIVDASERRSYERELLAARQSAEAALQVRDQFVSLAAHELKTPLTALLGNIELLQRRAAREQSLTPRDQRTLQLIADQTNRLNAMIHSLLDVSRIQHGQLAVELAPLDLCELIRRIIAENQATLAERTVLLDCAIPTALIQGDALRLEQVFLNLLYNAAKYSAAPTPISVVVRGGADAVCVDIADQGIGIPAAAIPRLFQRFFRAANVVDQRISGMGIGLYVVKQIVDLHGGNIDVESSQDQGSTFRVCLPAASPPDPASGPDR